MAEPILNGGYPSHIFQHMLFANESDWHFTTIAIGNCRAKDSFASEDSFGMMTQGTMTKICIHLFAFIKPIMDGLIIFGLAPVFTGATDAVMERVCHLVLLR
jgi:hypothetical protein